MSQRSIRGDIERSGHLEPDKKVVFLDYGELIMHYDFNKNTLLRTHNLVIRELNSRLKDKLDFKILKMAHEMTMSEYRDSRKDGSEKNMIELMIRVLELSGLKDHAFTFAEDMASIYKLNDHDVSPMPTTLESIPELEKLCKLGIISNLPHDSLKYELARYGLKDKFNPIVVSYQVGYRKPHPAIYQEALRRANIRAEEGTFFSHEQEEVDGAKAVGMQGHLVKSLAEVVIKLRENK